MKRLSIFMQADFGFSLNVFNKNHMIIETVHISMYKTELILNVTT